MKAVWPSIFDADATKAAVQKRTEAPGSAPETVQRDRNHPEFVDKLPASDPIGRAGFVSGLRKTDVWIGP